MVKQFENEFLKTMNIIDKLIGLILLDKSTSHYQEFSKTINLK